ncbi:hypothetical protein MUU72_14000 [Streptomyces sp. RS10V-4]|nr:hypothetical protein [Streptomyces rhizoryzae]MCK7624197.1 hypothetical protein [Streptomyces rhizoryzae]
MDEPARRPVVNPLIFRTDFYTAENAGGNAAAGDIPAGPAVGQGAGITGR